MNIKIGIITDSIRSQSTGIGFYAKDVINTLMKLEKKNEYLFIDFIQTEFNKELLVQVDNPFSFLKTYLWHNYIPFKTKNLDVDVILNFSACPHLFSFRQKEIFFVYDISWYLYPQYHPISRVLFYKLFFRRCLQNSNKIIVDSISTKNDLIQYFSTPENKIEIIYPSFIDTIKEIKKIQYALNFPYILYIGTLEPRKNIESILRAFKKVKEQKKIPHKLVLCGKKGWLYTTIFELIKTLALQDDIIYLGYISNEEKKYLYQHAEFFVFPSYYEGFGIPVQEAMSYGCPVITSNVSSLPEVAGDAGILVNPNSIDELTDAMMQLINDKQLRKKLSAKGLKQIVKISNTKQIQKLLDILEETKIV